ncbi:hypothetical protein LTR84_011676 [Exophiala bonariae]|uniref:Enoyl reductase (ER) domain-containing protein n=1 Tax=Exophiala bonariae TaxID=1690606 RepID=A0AAV9NGN3_9EURO|nr:hypothetical protein LTR84_011676 [Exophiala bonariae]
MMHAVLHDQKTESITISNVALPLQKEDEYLIKVSRAAFTLGELQWPRPPELVISTPGVEFIGQVVALPRTVSTPKFAVGARVYARVKYPNPGAAREYTTASEGEMARAPVNFTDDQAATVPVNALTAWQWLVEQAGLRGASGELKCDLTKEYRMLITGAGGSVGAWAVQLAAMTGATVIGTATGEGIDVVKSFGADEVIDYAKTDLKTWVTEDASRRVDIALNCVGAMADAVWYTVKSGGMLRTIVAPADFSFDLVAPDDNENVDGKFFIMYPNGQQLEEISKLIESGKLKAQVDQVFDFGDAAKALERLASRKTKGKVVLRVGK